MDGQCWSSLEFVLPSIQTKLGKHCMNLGKRFCLMGMYNRPSHSDEKGPNYNRDRFDSMIGALYQRIHFFSFKDHEYGGCCDYQKETFLNEGWSKGISLEDYALSLTDFRSEIHYKKLNWVKAIFAPEVCLNVISQVGFGSGPLRTAGTFSTEMGFAFPFTYGQENIIFSVKDLQIGELTFSWFKEQFVCQEQPWLCQDLHTTASMRHARDQSENSLQSSNFSFFSSNFQHRQL
ncbi:uncharacterized protein LOC142353047 isoform X2 [Convolutriloba macropyga]